MQVHFDPAGGAGDILSMILCSPALDKAHPNGTHLGKLIDGLKAMVNRLSQKLSKLLVVENLQATSTGDLAHSGRVEAVVVITVTTLNKNAGVAEALRIHLPSHIVQVHSFANVSAGVLDCRVTVDVGQQSEAEAVFVV